MGIFRPNRKLLAKGFGISEYMKRRYKTIEEVESAVERSEIFLYFGKKFRNLAFVCLSISTLIAVEIPLILIIQYDEQISISLILYPAIPLISSTITLFVLSLVRDAKGIGILVKQDDLRIQRWFSQRKEYNWDDIKDISKKWGVDYREPASPYLWLKLRFKNNTECNLDDFYCVDIFWIAKDNRGDLLNITPILFYHAKNSGFNQLNSKTIREWICRKK